jgi:ABC-type dipeptide/oligopeptide/nickel transport system permease subunit
LLSVCSRALFLGAIVGIVGICIGNFKGSIFGVYRNLADSLIYSLENFCIFFSSMKM